MIYVKQQAGIINGVTAMLQFDGDFVVQPVQAEEVKLDDGAILVVPKYGIVIGGNIAGVYDGWQIGDVVKELMGFYLGNNQDGTDYKSNYKMPKAD